MAKNAQTADRDPLYLDAAAAVKLTESIHQLNQLKARYLGRAGILSTRLREIGQLPPTERAAAGTLNNALRRQITELFEDKRRALEEAASQLSIANERLDVTLPGRRLPDGAAHPLQQTIQRATSILSTIGFEVVEGPEIENDEYNFTALNIPPDHPARDMHDTLYLQDNGWLLRTHTSPVQIRHMQRCGGTPPIRAVSPGRVYRRDNDATHSPMFHQIEGLWVDDSVRFTDLKGVLGDFFRVFFEDEDIELRFRPSFFPFTEPSAECDIRRGKSGNWLEVAGCGMVHPNVLTYAAVDAERYQGFAFGMGVERLAMLYYGIEDIRLFFENDMRFLRQFGR